MNCSSQSIQLPRGHKSTPCHFYGKGHCPIGDGHTCSPDIPSSLPVEADTYRQCHKDTLPVSSVGSSRETPDARLRPKRAEIPCQAWKAGTCTKEAKCWFKHDIDAQRQESEPPRSHKEKSSASSPWVLFRTDDDAVAVALSRAESELQDLIQKQTAEAALATRERKDAISREEASKKITRLVYGSIVTYSAGLDVSNLVTGFDTCTLRIRNLPSNVQGEDIRSLLRDHGVGVHQSHISIKKKPRVVEAFILTDIATGRGLAEGLDGVEFQDETLVVEMNATNSLDGMSAGTGRGSEILTISWRAPSASYVAEYVDIQAAHAMVKELDRIVHNGRRIKVSIVTHPRDRFVLNPRLNAIRINNLPPSITDQEVMILTGALFVERLPQAAMYTMEYTTRLIRADIERAVPGGLRKFDDPPTACTIKGVVSARAHFSSWDDANTAHKRLLDERYGDQPVLLQLPDPMYFTLVIRAEQYKAQKAQWDSLMSSIKDRKACTLDVRASGNVVTLRLSGSVKEAMGAMKVRVENLARGEKIEGWHREFGIPGNAFVPRVYSETGAYLRPDGRRKSLKLYGMPGAIDRAREMIKDELERLASLDHSVTLARHVVGFFVREGIQQLKETLGENNVRFTTSSRKLTVSGGEEARHALDRVMTLSRNASQSLPNAARGDQTCPVCYDNVSSPHQLGCGHTYCVACLRHLISSALESDQLPLICLGDEAQCRVPIAIPTIKRFLHSGSFNQLLRAALNAYIAKHHEEFKHCKTPDCIQIYRAARRGAAPQTLHCPSCFSVVCNGCHEEAHDGLSCANSRIAKDPVELERLNDAWIASQRGRVKRCPQCNVPIEKLEGCNHMACRCGAHICWRCMGVFTAGTIYAHMHAAHEGIYGDLPVIPEPPDVDIGFVVNIDEQRELLRRAQERRVPMLDGGWDHVQPDDGRLWRQARDTEERRRAQVGFEQNRRGRGCAIM